MEEGKRKLSRSTKILSTLLAMILIAGMISYVKYKITEKIAEAEIPPISTCEWIEDITQREGVSYENLIFSYDMLLESGNGDEYADYRYLAIFNTGEVYCFKWAESYPWAEKDSDWKDMQDVAYLGDISDQELGQLINNIDQFDIEERQYVDPYRDELLIRLGSGWYDGILYRVCGAYIYIHKNETDQCVRIERARFVFLGNGKNGKVEIYDKYHEENAAEIIRWFDNNWFREKFIYRVENE